MRLGVISSFCVAMLTLACSSGSDETPAAGGAKSDSGVGGSAGLGGAPGSGGASGSAGASGACPAAPFADPRASERAACAFHAGASVEQTLSIGATERATIPIEHLIVVMQENRSFDHYLGELSVSGQPDAEPTPASYSNPDATDTAVTRFHLTSPCLPADPPHQWTAMHDGWNGGQMDGFVKSAASTGSDGHFAIGYYDQTDLPFYYFAASTFAVADHYFGSALGGTWANRDYLYAGTSDGVKSTGQAVISDPTIFDAMEQAGVSYGVYTDGGVRQDCIGWTNGHAGVGTFQDFLDALADGSLPSVSFLDPGSSQDEHPPNNVHPGEAWGRTIYQSAIASPLWDKLAIVYSYDESGGLADHVPPPSACLASPDQAEFDHLGVRVPATVISAWARPHYVSKVVHDHTSTLRLIELLFDLPALTARDANADALLDMFDFECPAFLVPPDAPDAASGSCN
jgi:phospholipase C